MNVETNMVENDILEDSFLLAAESLKDQAKD